MPEGDFFFPETLLCADIRGIEWWFLSFLTPEQQETEVSQTTGLGMRVTTRLPKVISGELGSEKESN